MDLPPHNAARERQNAVKKGIPEEGQASLSKKRRRKYIITIDTHPRDSEKPGQKSEKEVVSVQHGYDEAPEKPRAFLPEGIFGVI